MYNIGTNRYTCDICGVEVDWNKADEERGEMWGCERCDTNFCSQCFIDRHGQEEFDKMLKESDLVLCPDCWEGERDAVS